MRLHVFSIILILFPLSPCQAKTLGVMGDLLRVEFTVQRERNGELSQGYRIGTLLCYNSNCSFAWLTINQCKSGVHYPAFEQFSSAHGNLIVNRRERNISVQLLSANYTTHMVMTLHQDDSLPGTLKDFIGEIVVNGEVSTKVGVIRYVPLESPDGRMVVREIDCPSKLPAIFRGKKLGDIQRVE
jgi:hypothetical protein